MSTTNTKSKRSSRRHRDPSPDDHSDSYSSDSSASPPPPPVQKKKSRSTRTREVVSDDDGYSRRRRRDPSPVVPVDDKYVKRRSTRHEGDRRDREDRVSRRAREDDYDDRRSRRPRRDRYDSSSESSSDESEEGSSHNKKSIIEDIMGAFGLIGAEKAISSKHRDESSSGAVAKSGHSSGRDRHAHEEESRAKKKQALQAAVTAAAIEAWRMKSDKHSTPAQRLMRIASAAIAAGGLDAIIDRKPDNHNMRHIAEVCIYTFCLIYKI